MALNPKKKIPFALTEKIELSHNTRLFRFALQSPRHKLGLPIGQHMFFYCKVCCAAPSLATTPASSAKRSPVGADSCLLQVRVYGIFGRENSR